MTKQTFCVDYPFNNSSSNVQSWTFHRSQRCDTRDPGKVKRGERERNDTPETSEGESALDRGGWRGWLQLNPLIKADEREVKHNMLIEMCWLIKGDWEESGRAVSSVRRWLVQH